MSRIQARKGRDGSATIEINEDLAGGTNFSALTITRAVIVMGGQVLDTDVDTAGNDITAVGNKITFKKGAFDLEPGNYSIEVVAFTADYPNGKTYIGPGYDRTIVSLFDDVALV